MIEKVQSDSDTIENAEWRTYRQCIAAILNNYFCI